MSQSQSSGGNQKRRRSNRGGGAQRHDANPDRRHGRGSRYRSFKLLYEDPHILAVAKPEGLLVTMPEKDEQTLQDQVRKHCAMSSEADAVPPSCVHRLDRYTSGVVLFGRTQRGLTGLSEMLRKGGITKQYYALVVGAPPAESGEIDIPLAPLASGRKRMGPANAESLDVQEALTRIGVEEHFPIGAGAIDDASLLVCEPVTGRTHQIRVHLAEVGCPIAGDTIYGIKRPNRFLRERAMLFRQFLHAREVSLEHPVAGGELKIQAKLPKDLANVLKALRTLKAG